MNTTSLANNESKPPPDLCAAPTVFVVDGDVTVRESLELLIHSAGWQPEVFSCAQAFLSRPRTLAPNCLLLGVTLPDLNGLDLQMLVAGRIEMPIIFIAEYADVPTTVRAMKAGAVEFLTRPFRGEILLNSVRDAIEHSHAVLRYEMQMQPLRDRYASLSRREREVMELVVSGKMNKQVGGELGISEVTVLAHRGMVMRKMKADSLAGLVRMAARLRGTRRRS
jgi:FixJ family two-component response regulator